MSGHRFTSVFAADLDAYLAFKQNMGFHGRNRAWYLRLFDAHCTEHDLTVFDRDTVESWVGSRLERSGRYRSWMSYIRDFGRWLQAQGNADAYVLSDRWKAPFVRATPYLFTTREIDCFFVAASRLEAQSPWRWQAAAFFTLMHSCGLRTGETRMLGVDDVDLNGGHVDIRWSKGNRSRRLPLTPEVVDVLTACHQTTRTRFPSRETFFVSAAGTPVMATAVGVMFNRIWDQAGLARPPGGKRPRPYAFRHHFAYANVERWMTEGVDVTAMLPYLAAYMGHSCLDSTYYYIHTSGDFLDAYAHITQSQSVLPEVGFE